MNSKVVAFLASVALLASLVAADHNCVDRPNYCENGGVCHDTDTTGSFSAPVCACPAPYTGVQCEKLTKECRTDTPCNSGATCTDMDSGASTSTGCQNGGRNGDCYRCTCPNSGWVGPQCKEQNACYSNPCVHGTCSISTSATAYTCSCPSNSTGTWGDLNCQTWYPTFNCQRPTTPCLNGGTCTGTSCTCTSDRAGIDCGKTNFCVSGPCANGGTCNSGSQTCSCTTGWAGTTCSVAKFCSSSPCQNGGTCTDVGNNGGGFCTCAGDAWGSYCENVWNEEGCKHAGCSNGGACGCAGTATQCQGNNWLTTCDCNQGFSDCQCNSTAPNFCSGLPNECFNGGTCLSHASGKLCQCPPGFYGDTCQYYDNICESNNKCQNGGRCTLSRSYSSSSGVTNQRGYEYWQCDCLYPYYGEFCENKADVENLCWNYNPCENGGNCTIRTYHQVSSLVTSGGYWTADPTSNQQRKQLTPYVCTCPAGLYGDTCADTVAPTSTPTCATSGAAYCSNVGTCIDSSAGPVCACPCGYAGDTCDVVATDVTFNKPAVRADFCSRGDVCYNGGSCYNDPNGKSFWCICQPGFWGTRCARAGKSAGSIALPSVLVTLIAVLLAKALNAAH